MNMTRVRRFIWRSLLALCGFYLVILILLVNFENRLVYPGAYMTPSAPQQSSLESTAPTEMNSGASSVDGSDNRVVLNQQNWGSIVDARYRTCDGLLLTGRLLEHDPSTHAETVLVFHGNGDKAVNLDNLLRTLSQLLNANVMAAEYRGYQDSHTPSEWGIKQDCLAARDFLCKRYEINADQVTLFGTSLGGGCATFVAANGGAKVVILDRTFDRLVDVAAERYPVFPVRKIMRNRFDSIKNLQTYQGPLIMIHGDADEIVSIERGKTLFDSAACSPKHWIEIPGFGHLMRLQEHTLREMRQTFLDFTAESNTNGSEMEIEPAKGTAGISKESAIISEPVAKPGNETATPSESVRPNP